MPLGHSRGTSVGVLLGGTSVGVLCSGTLAGVLRLVWVLLFWGTGSGRVAQASLKLLVLPPLVSLVINKAYDTIPCLLCLF